jgi:hypothetical protein
MEQCVWTPPMPTPIPEGYFAVWTGTEWVWKELDKPPPPPEMIPENPPNETQ